MASLKQLREKIDRIDTDILKKLAARKKVSIEIGKYKAKTGKKVRDRAREASLMKRYAKLSKEFGFPASYVEQIFKLIFKYSRKVQK